MKRKVRIYNTLTGRRVPRRKLERLGEMVLQSKRRNGEVNLVFIDDRRMTQLNREYRKRSGTTDVLSFNLSDNGEPLQGEIYISLPRAGKQATEFGHSVTREILKLACHGFLHLCDVHHPDEKSRQQMLTAEQRFLKRLEAER